MKFIFCTFQTHAAAILDIFNEAIIHSTALYDYQPRTPASMADWFRTKEVNGFPVNGAEDDSGRLAQRGGLQIRPLA
jgi:phosphinothricin acetyltransferase